MTEDQLKEFLKEHLKIRTRAFSAYNGGIDVEITLVLDNETISTDEFYIPPDD